MKATEPFAPLIVHSRGDITGALVARREALGLTGEQVDDRAGFSERYTAKLEVPYAPCGKTGFIFSHPSEVLPTGSVRASGMSEVWLETLGLRLVLVDAETAEGIDAKPAPARNADAPDAFQVRPSRSRGLGHAKDIELVAIGVRAQLLADMLAQQVAGHPVVAGTPRLAASAAAASDALHELISAVDS